MHRVALLGSTLALVGGYFAFKWMTAGIVNEERLVAVGAMYHWSALVILAVGWSIWFVRTHATTKSFWGDFRMMAKPVFIYALMAAASVYLWNHVVASHSTQLRKSIRLAQIDEHTSSPEKYDAFVAAQPDDQQSAMPDRETYREQASAQVEWMLSGGVTLVLSLLLYLFASIVLAASATLLLHHVWGIAS